MVIELADRIVGRANLNSIVRGAGQYASVGYWVAESVTGRGIATAAVAELRRTAFAGLNLHRLEAGTLPDNLASQRVLERNGFTRYGFAPDYVRIAGRWQDHVLYQALNPDWSPGPAEAYAG
ncbi:GNAT family N-acetyltransferase [Enemella evansiae]|nr:GNAT family protein [Enemella evansiae]